VRPSPARTWCTTSAWTSSISGTAGSLDFQFNPGPLVTQAASLQVLDFMTDGSLAGGPSPTTGN
jgi:hypothetical protein